MNFLSINSLRVPVQDSDQAENQAGQTTSFRQTCAKLRSHIDHYVSLDILCDRLADLPRQFENPQPRPWQPIRWDEIHPSQVIGIDLDLFLNIIVGAMDTEAPIRGYTQTSRQYLEPLHPEMARFVGGTVNEQGDLVELGLWEKEERQHSPALAKLYYQLKGEKIVANLRQVKSYEPSEHPADDLYGHGLHRIATEYSAVCLYLWLMAHTTGATHQLLTEILIDEVNHMTKFWGFGLWLYPESFWQRCWRLLGNRIVDSRHGSGKTLSLLKLYRTVQRMTGTLHWSDWKLQHKLELALTFIWVLNRVRQWQREMKVEELRSLFGDS